MYVGGCFAELDCGRQSRGQPITWWWETEAARRRDESLRSLCRQGVRRELRGDLLRVVQSVLPKERSEGKGLHRLRRDNSSLGCMDFSIDRIHTFSDSLFCLKINGFFYFSYFSTNAVANFFFYKCPNSVNFQNDR